MSGPTYTQRLADTIRQFGGASACQAADELLRLETRVAELLAQEHALSDAYVRLREILGAMSPPDISTPGALWAYVEDVARDVASKAQQRQDCEPMIAQPTYGSEEVRKLRETIASMAKIIQTMESEQGCPPFWPVVQVLLDEYGLQLIDIVAAYKQATTDQQRQDCEPDAWMDADGDLYATEPHKNWCPPHTPLYADPPKREPLSDEQLWSNDEIMSLNADLGWHMDTIRMFARAIERAHKIGGQS